MEAGRRPQNSDLDHVFQMATRVVGPPPRKSVKRKRQRKPLLVFDDRSLINELRGLMSITDPSRGDGVEILEPASPVFAFLDEAGAQIATIGVVAGEQLRWPARWRAEPPLLHPGRLQAWLRARGLSRTGEKKPTP